MGADQPGSPRGIFTRLMPLRCKLWKEAENLRYIFAERRVGYRMAEGEMVETESL